MLHELLLRDWILHRRVLLITYGMFGAFQIYSSISVSSPRVWLVFASIYAGLLTVVPFAREDKFRSTAWTCTLPVTRTQIVRARLIGAWVLVLAALAAAAVLASIVPGSQVNAMTVLTPANLLAAGTAITLIFSLMLPFTIRFGLMGVLIFGVVAQLLGGGLLMIGMISRNRGGGSGRSLFAALTPIAEFVRGAHETLPAVAFYLLALCVLAAVNWLGYRLALALFARREL